MDDDAVADERDCLRPDDAGRQQVEVVRLVAKDSFNCRPYTMYCRVVIRIQ